MVMQNLHHALERDALLRALSAFYGITTADGTPTTLICSALILSNDFISNKTILLQSGLAIFEDSGAIAFDDTTGEITVSPAFSSPVLAGTAFYVLNTPSAAAAVALLNLLQVKASKLMPWIDLWSAYDDQVVVDSVAGDETLPSITIAGLPAGVTIARAIMMLKYRTIENINAAVNNVNGAQNIQAKKAVGGAWITGIALGGGECSVPASTRESGDVMMGTADVSAQVPVNGAVMSFKWTDADAAQNSLNFNDVQVGLRIWFTV